MNIPQKRIDWEAYKEFVRANGGKKGTDKAFAERIGMDPNNFAQHKKRYYRPTPTPTNGDQADDNPPVETTALAIPTPTHPDASQRISASPAHSDASELDALTARVASLEAFLAAAKDHYPTRASERTDSASAHQDAFERIHEALSRLDARLHVVEAQANALPAHQDAPAHRIAPERTEPPTWVNRGTHFATDVLAAIDAYAQKHRMEKREVLDLGMRTFFALVAGEGADHHG